MAEKCEICRKRIEQTFLKKILGTYVKDRKGKKHLVCPGCQGKFADKGEILKKL